MRCRSSPERPHLGVPHVGIGQLFQGNCPILAPTLSTCPWLEIPPPSRESCPGFQEGDRCQVTQACPPGSSREEVGQEVGTKQDTNRWCSCSWLGLLSGVGSLARPPAPLQPRWAPTPGSFPSYPLLPHHSGPLPGPLLPPPGQALMWSNRLNTTPGHTHPCPTPTFGQKVLKKGRSGRGERSPC